MSRPPRIDPLGGWHHVTNHVAGNGHLFPNDDDRHLFLRLIVYAVKRTTVSVSGFSLMGNHFHLLLHCPQRGLSKFMQLVQSIYARHYSDKRQYRGPVFVDRFHNTVITSDEQFLITARYIDRNALELGIDIEQYPWSSYPTHVHGSGNHDPALNAACSLPVRLCGGPGAYQDFVLTDGPADRFPLAQGVRTVSASDYVPIDKQLESIVAVASIVTGVEAERIVAPGRGRSCDARLATVYVASGCAVAFRAELCEFFGFAAASSLRSTVARAHEKCTTHVEFRALVDQIEDTYRNHRFDRAA